MLWIEFTNYWNHYKNSSKIACACFLSLILHKAYNQVGIQVLVGVEVAHYSQIQIPKTMVDGPIYFLIIGLIPDATLYLVANLNPTLVKYRKMLGVDPRISTPKKAKSKSKGVTIKEPFADE